MCNPSCAAVGESDLKSAFSNCIAADASISFFVFFGDELDAGSPGVVSSTLRVGDSDFLDPAAAALGAAGILLLPRLLLTSASKCSSYFFLILKFLVASTFDVGKGRC